MTEDAAAPAPNGRTVSLRQIRVMISSTRADLMQYRQVAFAVLADLNETFRERCQIVPVGMETEDQSGLVEPPVAISKAWVEESDWVILIVGRHYGTITDEKDADGRSVTECEYHHARKEKKKVFIFLSGLRGSSDPYDGQGDRENLATWSDIQSEVQASGLRAFRKELEGFRADLFRNVGHFEARLRRTLTRALLKLPPDFSKRALRDLFASLLEPSIKPCYRGVMQLYRSKEIHDAIHRLRQQALVPLRDRVERKQKGETVGLVGVMDEAKNLLGVVTEKSRGLEDDDDSAKLKREVNWLDDALRDLRAVDDTDTQLPVEQIADDLDGCFSRLEKAFEAANTAMQRRNGMFAELHGSMVSALKAAGNDTLPTADKAELEKEIEITRVNRDRLLKTLQTHDEWQRIHREIVDATNVKGNKAAKRRRQVELETGPLTRVIEQIQVQAQADDEDISGLDSAFDKLAKAQEQLLALPNGADAAAHADAWHELCRAFDDSFFRVDERTLKIVGMAKERVEEIEESFQRASKD